MAARVHLSVMVEVAEASRLPVLLATLVCDRMQVNVTSEMSKENWETIVTHSGNFHSRSP